MHSSQIVLALLALALSVSSTALAIPKLIERPVSSNTHVTISWRVRESVASQTTCVLCIVTMAVAQWMRVSYNGRDGIRKALEPFGSSSAKQLAAEVMELKRRTEKVEENSYYDDKKRSHRRSLVHLTTIQSAVELLFTSVSSDVLD
jgi:predicted Kef-type K+ transport protein